jgi:hypothetical protein
MTVTGTPKFDQLVVSEITVNFLNSPVSLDVVAAFVNSKTGETHGWTKGHGSLWSENTKEKLKALREAMESDIGKAHFVGSVTKSVGSEASFKGGLGEHLDDTPQV